MPASPCYRFGEAELDLGTYQLRRAGDVQALEPKALAVLRLLVERAPHVVEKDAIFALVWKDTAVTDNALTRVVAQLRRALGDDAREPRYIATISTRGYRLLLPVEIVAPRPADPPASGAARPDAPLPRRRTAAVIAIAAALALVTLGAWLAIRTRTAALDPAGAPDVAALASLSPIPMTPPGGFDGFMTFSPDEDSIAFSSDRTGTMEVYVQGLAEGSRPMALTSNGRQNVQPVWSPDGRFIAYHEMAGNGIWIVSSRGGIARQLSTFGAHPSWSPDGTRIAFQSQRTTDLNAGGSFGATSTIWIADADGRTPPAPVTQPGQPAGAHGMPAWWPGSRHIVFAVNGLAGVSARPTLWTIDTQGGAPVQLSADRMVSAEFAIAPDGRGIYFSASGTHAIWWLPVSDPARPAGAPRPTGLPVTGDGLSNITVSPDGRHIGWTANDPSATIWELPMRAGGAGPAKSIVRIKDIGWGAGSPTVSADGRVAFIGYHSKGGGQIYLIGADGSSQQVTTDRGDHGGPLWIAGRDPLAILANHGDGPGYWRLDPETGHERLLFPLSALPAPPGVQSQIRGPSAGVWLTTDLSKLAVAYVRDGVPNLWTIALGPDGPVGPFVQRTFEREGASFASWSPDGRRIIYQCSQGPDTNLCLIDADGSQRRQLTRDEGQSFIGGWTPDGESYVFAARRQAVWNLAMLSTATGQVRQVTSFTEPRFYVRYPGWDPANSRIVFERFEVQGTIWSVEVPPAVTARAARRACSGDGC
jgi:Tol biopolymer transport system component/DNA-binding winged helix-turn-helix (wHTH) protein